MVGWPCPAPDQSGDLIKGRASWGEGPRTYWGGGGPLATGVAGRRGHKQLVGRPCPDQGSRGPSGVGQARGRSCRRLAGQPCSLLG